MPLNPVFVLCGPRRGSTLLRYILDTHSQIASPGEIELGALCMHLEDVIRSTQGQPASLSQQPDAASSLAQTREIVDRIMSSYAARKGKRIWCDKSIDNLHHLDLLAEIFPDARFVCLHRDVLDVVQSCLECCRHGYMTELTRYVVRRPENLIGAMMMAWIDHTAIGLEFEAQQPERCFRIRYEDLVTAPEDSLRPLLSFLGVEWEDGLLDTVFAIPHDQLGGDPKIQFSKRIEVSSVGSGQRLYLGEVAEDLKRRVDVLSAQLSYPPLAAGRQLPWPSAGARAPDAAGTAAVGGSGRGSASESGRGTEGDPGTSAGDSGTGVARQFVETFLSQRLGEGGELAAAIQGSCRLVLQGHGGGDWKLNFTGDPPSIAPGDGAADCSVVMSVADFEDIIAGRANPMTTLWSGRVTIEGNPNLAGEVAQLIYSLSQAAVS